MTADLLTHRLALSLRMVDHFSREPVADEFPVRLAGSLRRPVRAPGERAYRQPDGSYRFVDLAEGEVRVLWREPFARTHGAWVRWPPGDPQLTLPLADPRTYADVELWPAANASAPAAATGVRGRLAGTGAAGQTVHIAMPGQPFDRYTRSDDQGEFLFLLPGRLEPGLDGRVPLRIEVRRPDGTPRALGAGRFIPASAGTAFAGADFSVVPRLVTRIAFALV